MLAGISDFPFSYYRKKEKLYRPRKHPLKTKSLFCSDLKEIVGMTAKAILQYLFLFKFKCCIQYMKSGNVKNRN